MASPAPNVRLRARIETALRAVGPVLDLLLAAGDRLSRMLEPDDPDYVPARMRYEGESAPRGLAEYRARSLRSSGRRDHSGERPPR